MKLSLRSVSAWFRLRLWKHENMPDTAEEIDGQPFKPAVCFPSRKSVLVSSREIHLVKVNKKHN